MTKLSVVIPTFDTAAMTLRCCRAIGDTAEIIVADDASRDGTAELLAREMPHVRVVRLETNRGFAGAANRGVEAATGDVVLLLNSDAIADAGALRALLQAFASDPKLGVAGAQLVNEDGSDQWSGGRFPTLAWIAAVVTGAGRITRVFRRGDRALRTGVDWVSGAAMAFRREVWNAAGPLDERFRFYCQDIELCARARDAGWSVRIVPEARVVHAIGATIAPGSARKRDDEKLWRDLLDWGEQRYGAAWGRLARLVIVPLALAIKALRRSEGARAR